ncbi:MAG: hypothetical protein K6T78_04730 [Alicyclobacillus sp.]|nr:hypothetical protein [Alicyclobacillus sp.]
MQVRVKAYDFQAFCRGELVQVWPRPWLNRISRWFEAPVWDAGGQPMRAIVLPGFTYLWYAYEETGDEPGEPAPPDRRVPNLAQRQAPSAPLSGTSCQPVDTATNYG